MADETPTPQGRDGDVRSISITDEMKRSYVDYAMSVIVSRALPDVRDGLKPVHRRILFSMSEQGYDWNKPYRKSARVIGDVIGKYHPHGDQSVYDALVRMAQDFSMRVPLIDGQGNFGSLDGDPAAAMRYTEVRLEKIAHSLLDDLDKNTVDFRTNYDDSLEEPTVLPARFPNLLVNGAGGIAVGMATNIPPHNLAEVINATIAMIDDPAISTEDLMAIVPGPDFPTGGIILGRAGIRSAYETGRGSVIMRGRVAIETTRREREAIIVSEVPYQVNKSSMVEKIAELVREKRIEGISDLRDESDRDGVRVVIELKRDAVADVVLNQLYRFTPLQTSFGVNMVALNGGRPEQMTLSDVLSSFISFRENVVSRRTKFLLGKARDRAHVLVGLAIAVANIDEVIRLIRAAPDPQTAREQLMERHWPAQDIAPLVQLIADPRHLIAEDGTYRLSEEQARAILDLRLQRLTALGRDEIGEELQKLADEIRDYLEILGSRARVMDIIRDELVAVRDEFGTPRKTEILDGGAELDDEDLIQREDMVVTVSHAGYIKRVPLSEYRAQRRGGKGRSGMTTRDEDFVTKLFVANTHAYVLFFSSRGMVYKMKVWRLPQATPQGRGKALVNLLPLDAGERITSILPLPEDEALWEGQSVMFATSVGSIRRNNLSDCVPRTSLGKRVMEFAMETQSIVGVELCGEDQDVLLTTAKGQCIRFRASDIRVFGGNGSTGTSLGNRGIGLAKDDRLISLSILDHFDASPAERLGYLKQAALARRAVGVEDAEDGEAESDAVAEEPEGDEGGAEGVDQERFEAMQAAEQFVLTVNAKGFGKRSSSYEFRISGRGGKGIRATDISKLKEIGDLVAAFPVHGEDQIMLVSNGGTLIRVPVEGIRFASRTSKGVRIFNTAADEKVVSVEHIPDTGDADDAVEEAVEAAAEAGLTVGSDGDAPPADAAPDDATGSGDGSADDGAPEA